VLIVSGIGSYRYRLNCLFILLLFISCVTVSVSDADDWPACKFHYNASYFGMDVVYLANEAGASLPLCENPIGPKAESVPVHTEYTASLNITKTANISGPVGSGEQIKYEIMICNTGDVNVTDVKVYDDLLDGSPFTIPGTLVPGQCENVTDFLIYAVTDNDLCNGSIVNVAKASAYDYCCNTITATDAGPMILTDFDASSRSTRPPTSQLRPLAR